MEWFKKTTTCATPLEESHGNMSTKQIYAIFVGQFKTKYKNPNIPLNFCDQNIYMFPNNV